MNQEYKITTIIPIHNVEPYLEQTIKSVIHQTIGFKKNIQMILVNDGSEDNSESICLRYQKKYPNNIIYHAKKNEGVSVARNTGLKLATGNYINFLDSDDYIDKDFYKKAYSMLEEHQEIDLVAARLKYFEASDAYHHLDYKFTGDRIIDIMEEPQSIILHAPTALIRASVMKDIQFDARLKISEDTKVLYQIILQKEKYGILSSCNYHYRRRKDETSAIQTSRYKKTWYTDSIDYCHDYLAKLSMQKYGRVIPYVQYFTMYDIQWRIRTEILQDLNQEEKNAYIEAIRRYIKFMDDEVILAQRNMNSNYKQVALKVKYEENYEKYCSMREDGMYFKDTLFIPYDKFINYIELLEIRGDTLTIEGIVALNGYEFGYKINGEEYTKIETYERKPISGIFEKEYGLKREGYKVEIPLKGVNTIEFGVKEQDKYYRLENKFIHFSHVSNFKAGYYYQNKYLIEKKDNTIKVEYKPFALKAITREIYFLAYIFFKRKRVKVGLQRILYWLTKPFMPKNIWLFADREFMARDSGELMFRYTNSQIPDIKRNTYFVIDKHYPDYERMKQYGKVVSYHTMKYKLLFLNAKYIISSHADGYVNNAFGKARKYYIDLFKFEYIYLTHGILLHDSSSWLNRINKNIALNVVTSPLEYKSILEGEYYFKPEQLMKTGLPRHDNLIRKDVEEENKILIMASWRSSLAGPSIKGTQRRAYNPNFKESEYFQFYDRLFNDKNLQNALKKYNYKIKFCIHPSFREQLEDFQGNEFVEIAIDVDSQYETKSSKMLITDYSSAACDFAYLRKPVVYANFDLDHIYEIHYYNQGYFDYDVNGFGPNCKTYDETINEIVKCIENNCQIEEKYKQRCDEFFYYHDGNNCKRAYEAITKHDKERSLI